MLSRKETVILDTSTQLGEFDLSADGAYRNVKTFPLPVKQNRRLFVSVTSSHPIDAALSDGDGICIKFKESILNDTIAVDTAKKETIALVIGIFRGDKAEVKLKAWTE